MKASSAGRGAAAKLLVPENEAGLDIKERGSLSYNCILTAVHPL